MKLQVLISTMQQAINDHSLLDKMNIQSDAIVINQCDRNHYENFNHKGYSVSIFSFSERGVGLSRNNALMRATADICLFGDDDVTYVNDYSDIIIKEYKDHPDADVIIFNLPSTNPKRSTPKIKKWHRLRFYNCLRYGAYQISIKTTSIHKASIYFSLLFGGGARYSAGEDSLFLFDCIKKGLKVYASPRVIGTVKHDKSTWFKGYTEKYFIDKGAFFACLSKRWAKMLCLQFTARHFRMFAHEKSIIEAYKLMLQGTKQFFS